MSEIECIHCGEECGKHPILWEDKPFCCEGCKTVYQVLNENKLGNYYEIYKSPGIKVEKQDFKGKFAYLDKEEVQKSLIYFSEGDYSKVKLYIPDIHCSSCIWLLENLYQLNPAITQSTVNFIKKEVDIAFNKSEISLRQVVELLASIHYFPMINLESVSQQKNKNLNKKTILKLGVAGFVFGNSMLLSMPEYIPGEVGPEFQSFFAYLNLLLALPVLLYSSNDYWLSAYKNLRHKVINIDLPISIGIFTIFFESSYEILSGTGTGYMDSLAGLVFFLLIGKWYQNKTYQALSFERDYKSYFPIAVNRIKDGVEDYVPIEKIQKDDILVIHNQEIIPADCVLRKGEANINYSFVTGESKPVFKRLGDDLYAGGKQIGSTIEVQVNQEVSQSKLTQLWNQDIHQENKTKSLSDFVDRISKYFTLFIILVALISASVWFFIDPSVIVFAFSSVLIVACPCALALSIPFTYGNTMRIFGRLGFFLKKADVVEKLTRVDAVVFDKTGTITYSDLMSTNFQGEELTEQEILWVKSLARQSKHPLSTAIFEYLNGDFVKDIQNYREITSRGLIGELEGHEIRLGSAQLVGKESTINDASSSRVYLSIDGKFYGTFYIQNSYREGVHEVVNRLAEAYELHLISGDNDAEEERLKGIFGPEAQLHFNQSPEDKLEYIKKLKAEGKNVMMIGDGLNDAGALNESHVGISIADDIFSFSPACDAIMEAEKFKYVPDFIFQSHSSIKVVKISFVISFLYNIIGLGFAVSGQLSPLVAAILMPVSSVTVVAFVSLATNWNLRKLNKISKGKQVMVD